MHPCPALPRLVHKARRSSSSSSLILSCAQTFTAQHQMWSHARVAHLQEVVAFCCNSLPQEARVAGFVVLATLPCLVP